MNPIPPTCYLYGRLGFWTCFVGTTTTVLPQTFLPLPRCYRYYYRTVNVVCWGAALPLLRSIWDLEPYTYYPLLHACHLTLFYHSVILPLLFYFVSSVVSIYYPIPFSVLCSLPRFYSKIHTHFKPKTDVRFHSILLYYRLVILLGGCMLEHC